MKVLLLGALLSLGTAQAATITILGCDVLEPAPGTMVFLCKNSGQLPPPVDPPPPPVVVGLERFDAVPGDSDWARWTFWQSKEFAPLQARLMRERGWSANDAAWRINTQINSYQSTIRLNGRYMGLNRYQCIMSYEPLTYMDDVNGACDAYVAQRFPNALPYGELK